ncbi:MAG: hypothetical protein K1563_17745 [Candidatus Thiodiazotropha sp. (ex. Lucinisca nassula)]|nr:hypothetical protein [Candidatus Thiodiazotropha sp. (ex. Lucinisca nassula)]MBW9275526.1 hypothetical protein [Candidatus Thiodiazotropha sp. (ex. Lucinisca nassula)]
MSSKPSATIEWE